MDDEQPGPNEVFRKLDIIWNSNPARRVLQGLVLTPKTQRTLQRELSLKASSVSEAVCLLENHGFVRSWTKDSRRDKLYTATLHGVHLAQLLTEIDTCNKGGERVA